MERPLRFKLSKLAVLVDAFCTHVFIFVSLPRYLAAPSVSEKVNVTWAGQVSAILTSPEISLI
jgi:hypothetical protein